jgi:hypothetical protein
MANQIDRIVAIGDLEIYLPEDLTNFELECATGESDKEFQEAEQMYDLLFSATRVLLNRSGK